MKAATSAQLVTVCQPLATSESESGHNRLTFMPLCGQILDGLGGSMAGTDCVPGCRAGGGRGV